jgi:lysophospholipase L1-like esterase
MAIWGLTVLVPLLLTEAAFATAQEPVSRGSLINLWNDKAWKRFRNPSAELGQTNRYVVASLSGRRMTVPGNRPNDTHKIYFINEYTFERDLDGAVFLTHLSAFYREPHMEVAVLLNGKVLATFTPFELPLNLKIADTIHASDQVTVAVRSTSGKEVSNVLSFALESFKDGHPGPAIETLHPPAGVAAPKRTYTGTIEPAYQARHDSQQAQITKQKPRVIFAGDSITDGFSGPGRESWATLQNFHPANMGIGGDWTHNLLWRLENSVIDQIAPELIIVMIGTNDGAYSEDEVVRGIKAILDCIRKKSQTTRILLHGILPRDGDFPVGNRYEKINRRVAEWADGRTVIYLDLTPLFLTPDRKVRKDLLPDGLHPNAKGYEVWVEALLPKLNELLPAASAPTGTATNAASLQ